MGNTRSGRWDWTHRPKTLRELTQTLDLSVVTLDANFRVRFAGDITWGPESNGRIGFKVLGHEEPTAIQLDYVLRGTVVSLHIPLEKQKLPRGGFRWWGFCPRCDRRVAKLHRPAGQPEFACRDCHDLTYLARRQHDPRLKRFAISLIGVDKKTLSLDQLMLGFKAAIHLSHKFDAEERRERERDARHDASLLRRRTRRRLRKPSPPQA